MGIFLIILQILVALLLIAAVLLQPGNKGGVGIALSGAGGETVFGGRGANTFLSKLTFSAAVLFMVTNFALSFMSSSHSSVLRELESMQKKEDAAMDVSETKAKAKTEMPTKKLI